MASSILLLFFIAIAILNDGIVLPICYESTAATLTAAISV
jgi:hypothetical protein